MKMSIRFLGPLAATMLALAVPAAAEPDVQTPRPNVVVILMDDASFTELGAYGSEIATPNIDALAARGVRFSNYHASPICSPTRAMLLTGIDSHVAGVGNLPETVPDEHRGRPGYTDHLADNVVTVASMLQSAGYHTYMTGKWHLGHERTSLPDKHGFERSYALDASGGDNWEQRAYLPVYDNADWFENGEPVTLPKDFYSSEFIVSKMISYIDEQRADGKPFFAYLPFQAVHIPVQAPAEFIAKYEQTYADGWDAQRKRRREGAIRTGLIAEDTPAAAPAPTLRNWADVSPEERARVSKSMAVEAGMLEAMDHHVGRLIEHLKSTGAYDNTIFIVLSDNGPEPSDPAGLASFQWWLWSVGYKHDVEGLGGKGTFANIGAEMANANATPGALFKFYASEGGIRLPLIIAGPGIREGQTERSLAYVTDLTPTILALTGTAPAPAPAKQITGRSLLPVLNGAATRTHGEDDPVIMEASGAAAVFKGAFKLVKNPGPLGDGQWRLFNIDVDPGETNDLSAQEPDRVAAMKAAYEAYAKEVGVLDLPPNFAYDKNLSARSTRAILKQNAIPLTIIGLVLLTLIALLVRRLFFRRA